MYTALSGEPVSFQTEEEGKARIAERMRGRNFLLILDDLWRLDDLVKLPEATGSCTRLITTRDPEIARKLHARIISVGAMTEDESQAILSRGETSFESTALAALAAKLQHWPLLLTLARAALEEELARKVPAVKALANIDRS